MRGIDIIEAMENIDERLILDAKRHKKAPPTWIKFTSIAACLCCILLLGLLAINRILSPGEENVPDTLAPTEESAWGESTREETAEKQTNASENPAPVSDVPLQYEYPVGFDLEECIEFSEDGKTMTCFDPVSRSASGADMGIIWWIDIFTYDEFNTNVLFTPGYDIKESADGWYGYFDPFTYMYAKDSEYVYVLNTPTDLQFLPNDSESGNSYFKYTRIGLSILDSIIYQNDLELNPNWNEDITVSLFGTVAWDSTASEITEFQYVMSSYATTYTSNENRINNLQIACDAINLTVIEPGETFSFNEVVGERTAEKGYKEATVFTTGDDTFALGGGISQVASTLYYCCLYADLEIVERQGHVYHDAFIPGGMDAAVYWGSVDFKFKNNTDHDIRIDAYMSERRVWVELMATEEPQFTVDITQERAESDSELTYKIARYVYDLDGNLIRTDTTEDLDALGGLGTTVYALRDTSDAAAEPAAEEAAPPAAEVEEYPAYLVMEEDLVFADGITLCMTPSEVISILGTPLTDEIYGENDLFRMLDYDGAYCVFQYCEACGTYQLIVCCVDGENAPSMPLGLSYGMSVQEVLACFDAEDAQRGQPTTLYRYDDSHWASYEPVADTGLVGIQICVGEDISYIISFNRNDQVYNISFEFSVGSLICPDAS